MSDEHPLNEYIDMEAYDVVSGEHHRALAAELEQLREALKEYASHQHWRCEYRTRYGECLCGLDETMQRFGLDPVPVNDPEAKPAPGAAE